MLAGFAASDGRRTALLGRGAGPIILKEVTHETNHYDCRYCPLLLSASSFAAQDKATASKLSKEVQQDTKIMTANKTVKTSSDTVYGKVESYEPGKSIKVTVPGKIVSTKSFDLDGKDATVNVASDVKTGDG